MTAPAIASDVVYSVMIDPASDERQLRHAAYTDHLLSVPDVAVAAAEPPDPADLTTEEKRQILAAGIRARGETPAVAR